MMVSVHVGHCRCGRMKRADLSSWQFVAGIGELPTRVVLVDTVLVVLAVVGSRLSHGVPPASSSYDICGYIQNVHQQQIALNAEWSDEAGYKH
jgi:hypothetical protein